MKTRKNKRISLLGILAVVGAVSLSACGQNATVTLSQKSTSGSSNGGGGSGGINSSLRFVEPITEVFYSPTTSVAGIFLYGDNPNSFIQLIADFKAGANPSTTALHTLVKGYFPGLDQMQWVKLVNDANFTVTVDVTVLCADSTNSTYHIMPQDIFNVALTPGVIRTSGIAPLDGYCSIQQLAVLGTPLIKTCTQPDLACP